MVSPVNREKKFDTADRIPATPRPRVASDGP